MSDFYKEIGGEQIKKKINKKQTKCLRCGRIYERVEHLPDEETVEDCWKCVKEESENK